MTLCPLLFVPLRFSRGLPLAEKFFGLFTHYPHTWRSHE